MVKPIFFCNFAVPKYAHMYNLAIIGGGPAGYTAAEKASKAGLSVILFEKEALGGTCLNVGCIPTKTLLYSAKQFHNATHSDKYGIRVENATFDYTKIVQRKTKIVRKLVAGIKAKLAECTVITGVASVTEHTSEKVIISCAEQSFEAERLLICTGSNNFVPPIPGIADNEHIWSSTEALAATELPSSIVIIGGGVIGMEFATLFMELGVPVTVIEALPNILPNIDPEVVSLLRARYEKAGVSFLTSARVQSIEGGKVEYQPAEGPEQTLEADKILVCVGRRANLQDLQNLAGLELERNTIKVDEHMQTSLPNVYAAGDVTGKIMLAHVASRQAEVAVDHMLGVPDEMHYNTVPSVVYTNPEIAVVGLSESDAASNDNLEVRKLPMTFSGRFMAENEGETGLCKMIVDTQTDTILGVHMFGNPCSEFVATAAMAIQSGFTSEQLKRIIFPHPTVSEILKEIM